MEEWKRDLFKLTEYGCFGFYSYAKVTQIVLIDSHSGKAWNYFTNISFSNKFKEKEETKYLTNKPQSINVNFKLAITTYTISIKDFIKLYVSAVVEQRWNYIDDKIDSVTVLDSVFPTTKKFIPCNDPTGGQYQLVVPIEQSLYGSNNCGNYYIFELYSKKETINKIISKDDVVKIQSIIKGCHLVYDFISLPDRIGNIVCKFDSEIIKTKPLALGHRGIKYQISLSKNTKDSRKFSLHILQEHDHLIYTNKNYFIELAPGQIEEFGVDPNQYKNTIIVTDNKTELIVFMTVNDYSVYSNYYSQISPPCYAYQGNMGLRTFKINEIEQKIELKSIRGVGEMYFFNEMEEAGKRQQQWRDCFFESQNYLKMYTKDSHKEAVSDIHKIINSQLFWDLKEIWLIDPYLMPDDILETVLFCSKPNIKIKCLTDIGSIKNNKQTRTLSLENEKMEKDNSINGSIKEQFKSKLFNAIPADTDINLEYRTIANGYGMPFHDRYLILKYNVNKTRVWSLGISVNSLGKKHHIIQIVEAPELIAKMFSDVWNETNHDVCKIIEIGSDEY